MLGGERSGIGGCWGALNVAGAPAGVYEMPVVRGELDRVPCVVSLVGWWRSRILAIAVALTVATHDDRFEAAVEGEGGKELCIPLTDGKAGPQSRFWALGKDDATEEGGHVVRDVVVEPGEQGPGLFESGGERFGQGEGEA